MPVSIRDLKRAGVYDGAYKNLFTASPDKKLPLIKKLEQTLCDRIQEVRNRNLDEYRIYWAIDLAHEEAFNQTTPTMIHNLLAKNLTVEEMEKQLAAWGLSENDLFLRVDLKNEAGAVIGHKLVPNPPVFFQILIPVVQAYHTVRTASIFNERDTSPQFKFVPLQQTDRNRVLCDIWSDIVDTIANWYGYAAYKKQAIGQMLKYGWCLAFPLEEWHCEEQIVDGEVDVQKEGLRYAFPHPSKSGFDLYHPAPTINTDTGCEWGLHWDVTSYGRILDNRMYWNRKSITHSSTDWFSPAISHNYFTEVFPCQLRFPATDTTGMKRDEKAAFYGQSDRDTAVFLTTVYWKLIPKDWGLADYKYPVWHRFDVANDETVIWAAPSAYNPMWFLGYDWDAQAGMHSSQSLELIPWQDQLGNILSQMILTAKQNLTNIIYYDKNLVDKDRIKEIENLGETRYRSIQFIDFDSLNLMRGAGGLDPRAAFHQINFQDRSTNELQSMLSTALTIMERVLQFTAQETGAVAAHYQSAKEIGQTAQSSSVRRNFTASGVDEGFDAWRTQIATGAKAYLNNDVTAQVSADIKNYETHVRELGFEIKQKGDRKVLVAGKKSSLPLETFARSNVGPQQPADPQTAQAITQSLTVAFQNEQVFMQIGAKRIVRLLEQAVKLAGGPRDFDISSEVSEEPGASAALMQQLKPIFEQFKQVIMQEVAQTVTAPAAQKIAEQEQQIQQLEVVVKKLQQVNQMAAIEAEKLKMQQMESAQDMQIKAAQSSAEELRAQEAHALDLHLKAQKAGVDAKTTLETTAAKLRLDEQSAAVDAASKTALTVAKADAIEKTSEAQAQAAKKAAKAKPEPKS